MKKALVIFSTILISFIGINELKAIDTKVNYGSANLTTYYGPVPIAYDSSGSSYGLSPVTLLGAKNVGDTSYFLLKGTESSNYLAYFATRVMYLSISGFAYYPTNHYQLELDFSTGDGVKINEKGLKDIFCQSNACSSIYVSSKQLSSTHYKLYVTLTFNISSDSLVLVFNNNEVELSNFSYLFYNTGTNTQGFRLNSINIYKLDDNSALLDGIQKEQQETNNKLDTTINQNQTIIDQNNQTNNKLDNLDNSITDETPPDTDMFGDVAGWLPPGPVDSIITLPMNALNSISNALNGNCTSISLPLPFIDKEIELMCGSEFYSSVSGLNIFLQLLFGILGGITLYKYFVYLYNWIDRIVSLKEKDEKWGAV